MNNIAVVITILSLAPFFLNAAHSAEQSGMSSIGIARNAEIIGPPIIEGNRTDPLAGQVTTVTQEQIAALNAQDLPSALRMTPGVIISRFNPIGSFGGGEGGAVFIRGHGGSRPGAEIGMFVDGIPKFASVWTHPLMDTMNVDMADRIDVYKGAQPVLFGNMTFGAVNIVPKRMQADGYTTSLQTAYGSFGTWVEVAEHGGKSGPLDYYVVQSYRTSDGHRDFSDGEVQDYFGRIGFRTNENWNVGLLFESTLSSAHDPGSVVPPITRNGRFDVTDYFGIVSATHTYDVAEGYVKFYWDKGALDWVDQYNTTTLLNDKDTLTRYNNYGVKARETFRLWEGGEILAGCDLDYISGSVHNVSPPGADTDFNTETFRIVSPHFALTQQFDITEDIFAKPSAGFRYMFHDQFRDEMAPQAGVLLHVKDTEFHANYGRGVDYPGIFTAGAMFPTGRNWQRLTAETVNHYEIGASQDFNKIVKLDCNLFSDESSDRVMFAVPPFPPVWSNVGKTKSKGVETAVTVTPTNDLAPFAGFTYLNSDPAGVPYSPPWSASAGVTYRFLKHFRISLDSVFVDSQYVTSWARNTTAVSTARVESYMLVNARLSYDFQMPAWKLDGHIFLAGENLTDINYEQRTGYPMPGINGMGGFKVRF